MASDAAPSPDLGVTDQAALLVMLVKKALVERINALTDSVTGSVMAVARAFSMHADEVAQAYAGTCPDQGPDVDPLDLDSNYVVLLDALRRTRPEAYRLVVMAAIDWHDAPPLLFEQPLKMAALSSRVTGQMNAAALPLGTCEGAVAAAAAASLSTAITLPDPPPSEEQDPSPGPDLAPEGGVALADG